MMRRMMSFRKKILLSDCLLFLVFLFLLFPFVEKTVGNIMRRSLENRAQILISRLKNTQNAHQLVQALRSEQIFLFHWLTLLDGEGNVIYDSEESYLQSQGILPVDIIHNPEIVAAIQHGKGYNESYSDVFHETFAFVALSFDVQGKKYILRTGFPYHEIRELTSDFEWGFLLLGTFMLLLYSMMAWAIIHRLTQPIQQIVDAILPYQEGREEFLPRIHLRQAPPGDEFVKLANTLNSLNERIQSQIENLVRQKEETVEILESLGEGVIGLDASSRVTYVNRVACTMLGVEANAVHNQPLDQIKSREADLTKKCHEIVLQGLQTGEPIVQTWTMDRGRKVYLDLISAPLAHQSGAILVLQDKTSDYKVLEMGKDFIANASHELRTPITIIRGFAETLHDLPVLSQELLSEITGKIVKTCGRLDKLVKSLLTLSDIENLTDANFRTTDLIAVAENCKSYLLTAHPETKVTLHTELYRAPVVGDADLLDLSIMNLLDNAVKYSQRPAKIEMVIKKVDSRVQLSVSDEGIGIPEADLPHIFDRFYTVDKGRSRKLGGAGLGLSIVKNVIEKHRGSVTVVSVPGKGSTFTLSLPMKIPLT